MATVTRSVVVDAPATEAWARLADLKKIGTYHPNVQNASLVGDVEHGTGAKRRCELDEGAFVEEVVEWQEPRALTLRMTESEGAPWKRLTTAFRVEPVDERSVVAATVDFATGGLGLLKRKAVGEDLETLLAALKADAEGRPIPEPGPVKARGKAAKGEDGQGRADKKAARLERKTAKAERKAATADAGTRRADKDAAKTEKKAAKADKRADKAEKKAGKGEGRKAKRGALKAGAEADEDPGKPLVTMTRKEKAAEEEAVQKTDP